ncbi:MAG: hypothetical protein ACFB0Z_05045 [Candidatus Phaeomarinobacter sp.]
MALFFDQKWFTDRLNDMGRTPNDLAEAIDLPLIELAAVWKDQRELSVEEVRAMAQFLKAPVEEVASRAGVSTPIPREAAADSGAGADLASVLERLDEMAHRLDRLERAVGDIKALLLDERFKATATPVVAADDEKEN